MKIYTNRYHDFTPSQGIPVRITYGSPRWRLPYTIAAVDADVYEQAFRDYEERNGKTEWASTMYVLEGNQPTRLEAFVKAYNLGGMPMLDGLLGAQFDNGDADNVYLTNGEAWPI